MLEEHRHHNVAKALGEIATLIGKVQDSPVVLGSGEEVVPGLGLVTSADKLLERIAWLEEGCLRLAVVGAVSRGKSTLINALLGQKRLPVHMEACTGVITQIVHGNNLDEVTVVESGERRTLGHKEFLKTVRLTSEERGSIRDETMFSVPERLAKIDYAMLECEYPLGEKGLHIVDTLGFRAGRKAEEITKAFLANTDALLFVIRAHPLFEEEDEEFLKTQLRLNESRLDHIFFVINDFSRLDIAERVEVKRNARHRLKDYFRTPDGAFDRALFERRVFIVNARDALRTKGHDVENDLLEATGLPTLERGIQQMLDDEKRLSMVLEGTTTQILVPVIEEARRGIQQEKWLLSKDLSALEHTQQEVEGRLAELTRQADDIQDTFNAFTQRIAERAADQFEGAITFTMDEWEDVWKAMGIEKSFSPSTMVSILSKEHRDSVVKSIEERFQSYFATQTTIWESEVLEHLESDITEMATELEEKVQDFVRGLDGIQASMTDQEMPEILYMDQRLLQKAAGIFTSGLDSNLIAKRIMRASVKGTILHTIPAIVVYILGTIVLVSMSFAAIKVMILSSIASAIALVPGVMAELPKPVFNRIRDAIGEASREELSNSMPTMKSDIKTSINERFKVYTEKFLGALQAEIEQVRSQLDRTVSKKRAGEAQVTSEISRLDVIAAHLNRLFKQISHEVYGRVLTEEEYERLCQGNTILSENA